MSIWRVLLAATLISVSLMGSTPTAYAEDCLDNVPAVCLHHEYLECLENGGRIWITLEPWTMTCCPQGEDCFGGLGRLT